MDGPHLLRAMASPAPERRISFPEYRRTWDNPTHSSPVHGWSMATAASVRPMANPNHAFSTPIPTHCGPMHTADPLRPMATLTPGRTMARPARDLSMSSWHMESRPLAWLWSGNGPGRPWVGYGLSWTGHDLDAMAVGRPWAGPGLPRDGHELCWSGHEPAMGWVWLAISWPTIGQPSSALASPWAGLCMGCTGHGLAKGLLWPWAKYDPVMGMAGHGPY
jgi:hypothetical protein